MGQVQVADADDARRRCGEWERLRRLMLMMLAVVANGCSQALRGMGQV